MKYKSHLATFKLEKKLRPKEESNLEQAGTWPLDYRRLAARIGQILQFFLLDITDIKANRELPKLN